MSHTPTAEQTAILDHFTARRDNLVIEAGAGTGKTSTLRMLARVFPRARGVYLAYNRAIADEAARDFPRSVTCKTAHGLAFAAIGRRYAHRLSGPRMPARETARILGIREPVRLAEGLPVLSPTQLARITSETVGRFCYSTAPLPEAGHVARVAGLDDRATHAALCSVIVPLAVRAWESDLSQLDGQLKFSHDMYLKLWQLSGPALPADYVLLDEAQDSNPAVADIVCRQPAVQIMVGDRAQAIYGWRGATDAMRTFGGVRFQLSQSFRFGATVAAEANRWLDLLDTPLRLTGHQPIPSTIGHVDTPDAVLCRSNAGAVLAVMDETGRGRRTALVGGGSEIRRLAEAAISLQAGTGTDHPELFAFNSWPEVQEYAEHDSAGADLRVWVDLIDNHGPDAVIATVSKLVDEQDAEVTVSTAHKSKGREWAQVRIGSDFREPRPNERGQVVPDPGELMLAYVATTRARLRLDRGSLDWIDGWSDTPPPAADPWVLAPDPAPVVPKQHHPAAIMPDPPDLLAEPEPEPEPASGRNFVADTAYRASWPAPEPIGARRG